MKRRDFFRTLAVVPAAPALAALPEIPCEHPWLVDMGDLAAVTLVATRERDAPKIEIEFWRDELETCDLCGETWIRPHKVRDQFHAGGWRMYAPPVVEESSVLVAIATTCRMWVDGEEVDWQSFETTSEDICIRKRGFLE